MSAELLVRAVAIAVVVAFVWVVFAYHAGTWLNGLGNHDDTHR